MNIDASHPLATVVSVSDPSETDLVKAAGSGDRAAFDVLVGPFRKELAAHCYRMLGGIQDAEDALQETLLGAWRGLAGFEGRSSLRTWLYRIATNVCIRITSKRPKRLLSPEYGPSWHTTDGLGEFVAGPVWLEPWPDDTDPVDRYARRENIELAFVAALQHLPATQRAVLILRDVLDYSATETAELLDTTPASVNSALQRARKAVAERVPPVSQQRELANLGAERERELVEAFVAAWERADVDAIVAMLTNDARMSMPPLPAWYDGIANVRIWAVTACAITWRMRVCEANGQPALACYELGDDGRFTLGALMLLSFRDGQISELTAFLDPAVHDAFELPREHR